MTDSWPLVHDVVAHLVDNALNTGPFEDDQADVEVHGRVEDLRVVRDDGSQQPGRRFVVLHVVAGS